MRLNRISSTPAALLKARSLSGQHGVLGVIRSLGTLGVPEWERFPLVIKTARHKRPLLAGLTTRILATPKEVLAFFDRNAAAISNMLQEFIRDEDWIFHGHRNPETGVQPSFNGRKLRSYPVTAGPTSVGLPIENERLQSVVENLLAAINYAGIMDIDFVTRKETTITRSSTSIPVLEQMQKCLRPARKSAWRAPFTSI